MIIARSNPAAFLHNVFEIFENFIFFVRLQRDLNVRKYSRLRRKMWLIEHWSSRYCQYHSPFFLFYIENYFFLNCNSYLVPDCFAKKICRNSVHHSCTSENWTPRVENNLQMTVVLSTGVALNFVKSNFYRYLCR